MKNTIGGLDPGIRKTVNFLRSHGFETCDSGDGLSKFKSPEDAEDTDLIPYPHIVVNCGSAAILALEADKLWTLFKSIGLVIKNSAAIGEPRITATYDPSPDGGCVGLIELANVNDAVLDRLLAGEP